MTTPLDVLCDLGWVLAAGGFGAAAWAVPKYLWYRAEIQFFAEQYQEAFVELQALRDKLGMSRIAHALDDLKSGRKQCVHYFDYLWKGPK